jgi:hypothetical protein
MNWQKSDPLATLRHGILVQKPLLGGEWMNCRDNNANSEHKHQHTLHCRFVLIYSMFWLRS